MKTVLLLAAFVVLLDQGSKELALSLLAGAPVPVLDPCFELRLVHNSGAAWGMLAGRRFVLAGVSAAMLALLAWNRRDLCATRLSRLASGLLAGGIVGNLVDRVFRAGGRVVDFLHVHWRDAWDFPTFNVADSAITVGVALLLLASLPCFRAKR